MTVQTITTSPLIKRYTLQEFWDLPNPPGGGHYELIGGVLYMVAPPSGRHNSVWSVLNEYLCGFVLAHPGIGRVLAPRAAIWTDEDTYLEPDLMFLSAERLRTTDLGKIRSADLVIEISSPSTSTYDRTTKADTYLYLGVRELWLVDTERRIIEQRVLEERAWRLIGRFGAGTEVHAEALPGFICPVTPIFADLSPSS